jgi:TolB-like protein
VVLPFANLSDDREQQYFAHGITEDPTTDLSRLADTLVISRNTAFTYRNRSADAKQIGSELELRYVPEGSVQRSGNRDSDAGGLFTLQKRDHEPNSGRAKC